MMGGDTKAGEGWQAGRQVTGEHCQSCPRVALIRDDTVVNDSEFVAVMNKRSEGFEREDIRYCGALPREVGTNTSRV